MGKLTGVIRQTLEENKKNGDKGKEKVTGESSKGETRRPSFKTFKSNGATEFSDVLNPIVVLTWIQNSEKYYISLMLLTKTRLVILLQCSSEKP